MSSTYDFPGSSVPASPSILAKLEGDSLSKIWIRAHMDYPYADFCLLWPFSRSGGGYANFGADHVSVHRLMCEHRHGPPPSPEHHAAHSCARGKDGCVNPNHLDWKTSSENGLDRARAGHVWGRSKLTVEQVDKIISYKGRIPVAIVAEEFGIGENAVRSIQQGRLWNGTSTRARRVFSDDEIRMIRKTPWQVKSALQFANEFGVSRSSIGRIRERKSYKWVTP